MAKATPKNTVSRRAPLLSSIDTQVEKVMAAAKNSSGETPAKSGENAYNKAMKKLSDLYDRYEKSLHKLPLSRCPHTGEVVTFVVDDKGLDGPFWDCTRPIRPAQILPQTVFAYCGAIDCETPDPTILHEMKPGPGQPYLVPRFMQIEGMKAVISSLKIGDYDAFTVFYFHENPPYDAPRINYWGANYHVAEWQKDCSYTLDIPDLAEDFDFDILPYLKNGSAYWITPNDRDLVLRSTSFDYPFQNLAGRQFPVKCIDGKVLNSFYISSEQNKGDAL